MSDFYSLSVIFHGDLADPEQVTNILYGAGCDDATVSAERDGSVAYADFEPTDARSAVVSAVGQIEKAGFIATSVGGDRVIVAYAAERTGRNQQTISACTTGTPCPDGFSKLRIERHWGAADS